MDVQIRVEFDRRGSWRQAVAGKYSVADHPGAWDVHKWAPLECMDMQIGVELNRRSSWRQAVIGKCSIVVATGVWDVHKWALLFKRSGGDRTREENSSNHQVDRGLEHGDGREMK